MLTDLALTFTPITRNGKPWWLASNGRLVPVIRGGSDEGEGEGGAGEGEGSGAGDEGEGGGGKPPTLEELAAERDKWKFLSKKHEAESKTGKQAAKELEELRKSQMSDNEKAVEAARAEGRREAATLVAAARIEAALTGIVPDPAAIVEDLNLAKYVTDKGDVDAEQIASLKEKYAALKPTGDGTGQSKGHPDMGQGRRQGTNSTATVDAGRDEYAKRHAKKT